MQGALGGAGGVEHDDCEEEAWGNAAAVAEGEGGFFGYGWGGVSDVLKGKVGRGLMYRLLRKLCRLQSRLLHRWYMKFELVCRCLRSWWKDLAGRCWLFARLRGLGGVRLGARWRGIWMASC